MAQRIINTGTADYAGDGESLRDALIKVNDNFTEVYADLAAVQSFDGDYNSLTNKPDLSVYALTANTFNGDYNNLTNLPDLTTLATFDGNLGTVTDVTLTNVTDGQVLAYDSTTSKWVNAAPAAGGSSFDQDLNTTDNVTFNTVTTPNLVLDGDVTTQNELFIDGGAQAIGIKSQVNIVMDGDVIFQNGTVTGLNVAGGIALTDLSIGADAAASGAGGIAYDNTTGVFTYTPPSIPTDIGDLTDNGNLLGGGVTAQQIADAVTGLTTIEDLVAALESL